MSLYKKNYKQRKFEIFSVIFKSIFSFDFLLHPAKTLRKLSRKLEYVKYLRSKEW